MGIIYSCSSHCFGVFSSVMEVESTSVDRLSNLPDDVLSLVLTYLPTKDAAAASVVSNKMKHAFTRRTSLDFESTSVDRLSSLPDDVLSLILTLLPTKDAAAASVVSKKMKHAFAWRTSLDFHGSTNSYALQRSEINKRYETFETLVNSVLQSFRSMYLTDFHFCLGGNMSYRFRKRPHYYGECVPDICPLYLYIWIRFPLTRQGLREIDLYIHVKESALQLPWELFTCETLEVLLLDVTLDIDQVCSMPCFNLPNLKLLQLCSVLLPDNSFLTRLVSSCPNLEVLIVGCWWKQGNSISISSASLRRLYLDISRLEEDDSDDEDAEGEFYCSEHVLIDAPYLEYLFYDDNLAFQYSITTMNALDDADIHITQHRGYRYCFEELLSLIRVLSNVSHLYLDASITGVLDYFEGKDEMPVFHRLKHLKLYCDLDIVEWDKLLLEFLRRSPVLETLSFPRGLGRSFTLHSWEEQEDLDEFECQVFGTTPASCLLTHLKQILIIDFWGEERELNLVKFLLLNAPVLEELTIHKRRYAYMGNINPEWLESTLKELPKASSTCSFDVREHRYA